MRYLLSLSAHVRGGIASAVVAVEATQIDLALLVWCGLSYYAAEHDVDPGGGKTPPVVVVDVGTPSASPSVGRGRSVPGAPLGLKPASSNLSSAGSCSSVVVVVDVAGNIDR